MEKIKFKDLSISLKVLVIFGWIITSMYLLVFMVGFIIGLAESLI